MIIFVSLLPVSYTHLDVYKRQEGRIWTGDEAVKIGLADEIGGLKTTISSLAEDNNIDDYTIVIAKDKLELGNIYKKYSRYRCV